MASFRKRRGVWYARVQWYEDGATRQTEKLVALRTSSTVTARERMAEVNKVEDDIKQGMDFSFPWFNPMDPFERGLEPSVPKPDFDFTKSSFANFACQEGFSLRAFCMRS